MSVKVTRRWVSITTLINILTQMTGKIWCRLIEMLIKRDNYENAPCAQLNFLATFYQNYLPMGNC